MEEEVLSLDLKKIDKTRNCLLEEIKNNDLMGKNIRRHISI